MIRKIFIITALAILPLFAVTCTDNSSGGQEVSIKIDFAGSEKVKSIEGISVQKAYNGAVSLPAEITSLRIKVYSGNESDGSLFDQTFPVSEDITIEVPSGLARIFKVYGINIDGDVIYTGVSTPVDLIAGEEISVSITLSSPAADANFSIKLLGEDGVTDFAEPTYLSAGTKFTAEVFMPTIVDKTVTMGDSISTMSSTVFTTTLTGLNAFAITSQLVIVRAFTLDGTIAAIGIVSISNLSSGTNSKPVPVTMVRPGRINITNNAPITSIKVEMEIGGTGEGFYKPVADSGISSETNSILVSVPNHKTNIGNGFDLGSSRNIRITVNNGTPKVIENMTVKWKLINLDFLKGTWTETSI